MIRWVRKVLGEYLISGFVFIYKNVGHVLLILYTHVARPYVYRKRKAKRLWIHPGSNDDT